MSERIGWLCDELGLAYALRHHARDPVAMRSPPELEASHPLGAALVIEDGDVRMAESAAIVEDLIVLTCAASASGPPIAARWPGAIPASPPC